MQHPDNVDYPPLMSRPVVFTPALAMLFGLLWYVHLGSLAAKQAGVKALADLPADVIGAALAAGLVALAWRVWVRLALRWQMALVWLGLAGLLLYFFYSFDLSFDFIRRKIGFLVTQGLVTTIYISAISIVLASLLAMVGAIAKLSQNGVALGVANFYTSLFRGTPLLMQLYMIYLGLPQLGIVIGPIPAGVAALSLCYGAYMTEIFRAGIENIPRGQWEAARALGIKPFDTLARIILPQAMRIIIPPTGNQFIAMLKDSSLVSVVGVWELMYLARTQGQTEFRHLEMMITAALIYWLLSMVLEVVQARLERHFNRAHMR